MKWFVAGALALLTAACANDGLEPRYAANDWAVSTASPVGPPISCVEKVQIQATAIRDARTIDFTMNDGRVMRNRLPNACPRLTRDSRFVYRTALDRVCSTDAITLVQPNGRAGDACGLGQFQPIAVPAQLGPRPGH